MPLPFVQPGMTFVSSLTWGSHFALSCVFLSLRRVSDSPWYSAPHFICSYQQEGCLYLLFLNFKLLSPCLRLNRVLDICTQSCWASCVGLLLSEIDFIAAIKSITGENASCYGQSLLFSFFCSVVSFFHTSSLNLKHFV